MGDRPTSHVIGAAAQWAATLDADDATDADRTACEAWCAEHPSHREAWARLQGFTNGLNRAGILERDALRRVDQTRRARRRRVAGGAALALVVLGGWAGMHSKAYRDTFPDYRTRPGEQRQIALADGSSLTIDTNSAANASIDDKQRVVRLVRGQILAKVGKAAGRPFVVETPDGTATALGTAFVVRKDDEGTIVTVIESHVRACPAAQLLVARNCTILGPGQSVRLLPAKIGAVSHIDPAQAGLWASGWLEADDEEVGDLLAELNRYRERPVRFDRARLAGLRLTGSYPLKDTDRAIEGIAVSAHLAIDRTADGEVSLRPPR